MILVVSCHSRHGSCTSGSCSLGMATVRPVAAPPTGQGHTETNNMGTTPTTHICCYLQGHTNVDQGTSVTVSKVMAFSSQCQYGRRQCGKQVYSMVKISEGSVVRLTNNTIF